MRGSVFGAVIPSLNTNVDIDVLQKQGYRLGFLPSPRNLETQKGILEAGVIAGLDVLSQAPELAHVTLEFLTDLYGRVNALLLDVLFASPSGIDFFRSRPKEEIATFAKMALLSELHSKALPLVTSTCPDYELRSYRLRDGVGIFAERTIEGIDKLHAFFKRRGVIISVAMHLADGDAADSTSLMASGETRESFLRKTETTVRKIELLLKNSGRNSYVSVVSMSSIFEDGIEGYARQHVNSVNEILRLYKRGDRRVKATIASLMQERKRLGDFDYVSSEAEQVALVIGELAGYDTYGKRIAGRSLIVSPGAKSVVPAYNFNSEKESLNPVIYVYDKKEKQELFAD